MAEQSGGTYPVDNNTYNLLQTLTSKLEAIEAYQKYLKDANEQSRGVFQQLLQDDRQHADLLLNALRQVLQK